MIKIKKRLNVLNFKKQMIKYSDIVTITAIWETSNGEITRKRKKDFITDHFFIFICRGEVYWENLLQINY